MIIASFDIGIKNLAYCVLTYNPTNILNKYFIYDWDVINLFDDCESNQCCKCNETKSNKSKNETKSNKSNKKNSYYKYENKYYCKNHLRINTFNETEKLNIYRTYSVKNIEYFELAKLMIESLDKIDFKYCDQIIIESQPNLQQKMKNLSMLLFNYFIIKYIINNGNNNINNKVKSIQFINSRNKLKVYDGPYVECNLKNQYNRNKYYSKEYCKYYVSHSKFNIYYLNSKKQDDLADCFLQGVWYLLNNYIPDLKTPLVPDPIIEYSNEYIENSNEPKKIKLKFLTNENMSGKEILENIKNNNISGLIIADMNINKFKLLKRGVNPKNLNKSKFSLSELKYIINNNITITHNIKSSIEYYFNNLEYLLKNLKLTQN